MSKQNCTKDAIGGKEIWKDVSGFEGVYQVSNKGRVQSLDRIVRYKNGRVDRIKGKVLRQWDHSQGYLMVGLCRRSKYRFFLVHRLVLCAFVDPPTDKAVEVCHGDGNKKNNHLSNLRWGTRSENLLDRRKHGRVRKLTAEDVQEIRKLYDWKRGSRRKLSERFGVCQSMIAQIVLGQAWK